MAAGACDANAGMSIPSGRGPSTRTHSRRCQRVDEGGSVEEQPAPPDWVDYTEFPDPNRKAVRRRYLTRFAQIDDQEGRIATALRDKRLENDTLVILISDHGDFLGDRDLVGKNCFYRQATKVPKILAGPGVPEELTSLAGDPARRQRREELQRRLDRSILDYQREVHGDKHVDAASADPDSAFHRRGWHRPYSYGEHRAL